MKTKLLTFTAFLTLLLSQLVFAQCATCVTQTSCTGNSCTMAGNGCSSYFSNCMCTDPACSRYDSCLDRQTCCKVFGNIGQTEAH